MSEDRRAARRAAMPQVTSIVEELEAQGLAPKVVYASENGIVVGNRPQYLGAFDIPRGYCMPASNAPTRRGKP